VSSAAMLSVDGSGTVALRNLSGVKASSEILTSSIIPLKNCEKFKEGIIGDENSLIASVEVQRKIIDAAILR
jgi:hypothetical protein